MTALEVLIAEQPSDGLVSWKELMDMSLELCEILSQEFILCKPCQDLEDYVRESIHKVSCKDWIRVLEVRFMLTLPHHCSVFNAIARLDNCTLFL